VPAFALATHPQMCPHLALPTLAITNCLESRLRAPPCFSADKGHFGDMEFDSPPSPRPRNSQHCKLTDTLGASDPHAKKRFNVTFWRDSRYGKRHGANAGAIYMASRMAN
jgi:hypothetical protein